MAKLEIFIGYLGLIPQYHILTVPDKHELFVEKVIPKTKRREILKKPKPLINKCFNYKKYNKRSTNYEGSGLNERK